MSIGHRLRCAIGLGLGLGSLAAFAQNAKATIDLADQGKNQEELVSGKPYSAQRVLHMRRSLADGTMATSESLATMARDSQGRSTLVVHLDMPQQKDRAGAQFTVSVVFDPQQRTVLQWSSLAKTATLTHLPALSPLSTASKDKPEEKAVSLGHRVIQGLLCSGYRTEQRVAAGTMGNEDATKIRHEWWINDELQVRMLEIFHDPQQGERTFEVLSLQRGEPDAHLFHLPDGYAVRDINPAAKSIVAAVEPPLDLEHAPAIGHAEALALLASQDQHRRREGAAVLVREAQHASDAAVKDDVAYRLARAGVGGEEALLLSRSAVESAEKECATLAAPLADRTAVNREIALARYWHTLGYLYDHKGEKEQARSYLEDAWKLDPLAYYGFHLAQLAEQSGDTNSAILLDRAALQAPGGDEMKTLLRERLRALAGNDASAPVFAEEPLAQGTSLAGTALFDLTFSPAASAPSVVFVRGADALRSLDTAIAHQETGRFVLPDHGPESVVRRFEVFCGQPEHAVGGCRLRALGAHETRDRLHP